MRDTPALVLRGISKRYGAVQALKDVTVEVTRGEIHAVLGENGSGKSTLLGVASGVVTPDDGEVEIGGVRLGAASAKRAMSLGLGMAYQTFSEVLDLSVAENLYLAAPGDARPPYNEMVPWAAAKLADAELPLDPTSPTGALSLAARQMLEVVQALLSEPSVLLLDEPTTALGPQEVDRLHELVIGLARKGVGVIYVSHRLPEVREVADRVTVLRDGICQGTFDARTTSEADVVALMIGRPLEVAFPTPQPEDITSDEALLDVTQLQGARFGPVDLTITPGEIVGIAGAEGNGQVQLLRALAALEPSTGDARSRGRAVDLRSPRGPLAAGVVLLSGERQRESVFTALGVRANATLQVLNRFGRFGFVRRSRERVAVNDLARKLQVRAASIEQPVQYLSGGNQQKVALMRPFLKGDVTVILADEPTQGVDVRSRLDIYEALREKADDGAAVVIKSSDPIELSGLCDRVVVMSRGVIVDEIPAAELDERRIIEAIVGERSAHQRAHEEIAVPEPEPDVDTAPAAAAAETGSAALPAPHRTRSRLAFRSWVPIAFMVVLMVLVGAYTQSQSVSFLSEFNLNGLLIATIPLSLAAMGQTSALMVRVFDVSVGGLMTVCVVVASFTITPDQPWYSLIAGALAVVGVGLAVGLFNVLLIRILGLSSIIATLATLSILQGLALWLRPVPEGIINRDVTDMLLTSVGFVPIAFIGVVVIAIVADVWLYRTVGGLATRAAGLDETSAERRGVQVGLLVIRALFGTAFAAAIGAFFLAAQVGVGDPNVGLGFTLTSIAAAVLGGASLVGGRGSFIGAVVGALFLNLIINILPFLGWSSSYGRILVGVLTLVALCAYQAPDIYHRTRQAIARRVTRPVARPATDPAG